MTHEIDTKVQLDGSSKTGNFLGITINLIDNGKKIISERLDFDPKHNTGDVVASSCAHIYNALRAHMRNVSIETREDVFVAGLSSLAGGLEQVAAHLDERHLPGSAVIDSDQGRAQHMRDAADGLRRLSRGLSANEGGRDIPVYKQLGLVMSYKEITSSEALPPPGRPTQDFATRLGADRSGCDTGLRGQSH